MKKNDLSKQIDKQKLIHYLQKTTQILLNLFNLIKATPTMIQISNVIDYVKNLELMLQQFYKIFPKKCVSMQVFKKIQNQSIEKSQKIAKHLQTQKNLKIQVKVLQQKLSQFEFKLKEKDINKQLFIPTSLQKLLHQKQSHNVERYNNQKSHLMPQKKRLSLPYLPSSAIHLSLQKTIRSGKSKKNMFVNIPGQGNQILIQHLMNKMISK